MRFCLLVLTGMLLAACGGPTAATPIIMSTAPVAAIATATVPTRTPTAVLIAPALLTAMPAATALPTAVSIASNATPTVASPISMMAAASVVTAPFDISLQAAALLPAYQSDLDRAGEWNHYTLDGTIDPAKRVLKAAQRIEYTNRDRVPLDKLYFHLYPNLADFGGRLDVTAVLVDGQPQPPTYEQRRYLLRVDLPQPLAAGASTVVMLDFQTAAPQNASRSKYGAFNKEQGVLALASALPIVAVVRGGVWDIARPDPKGDFVNSETALYDVTLAAPIGWKLVTTGVAIDYRAVAGRQTTRFVSGPQRDFTITALQLESISAEVDGTRINSYYRSGSASGGKLALDVAANAVRVYNKRYGPYLLRELDLIEIAATQFLGVEYPGLTMINQAAYADAATLETTVAHEVGHMWFYSIVGNDTQRESWLDEAFASYSQIIYKEEILGSDAARRELQEFRNRYQSNRAAGRDAAVAQDNHNFGRNYVPLVYGKAVLFIQALRQQLGEDGFDRFLHSYYNQHRYDYVGGDDLLATVNSTCGCALDRLYQDWILKAVPVAVP